MGWLIASVVARGVPWSDGRCLVFAVLVVATKTGQAGVTYFSNRLSQPGSAICDCELAPLSPALLHGIFMRLAELAEACSARWGAMLFTTSALSEALERLGHQSEIIDQVLSDKTLSVSAAAHVIAQRVRVHAGVLTKNYPLAFLQGAAAVQDDDDPLRVAFLAGLAVALDTNRNLGRAAA